jgi:hypothetical protein
MLHSKRKGLEHWAEWNCKDISLGQYSIQDESNGTSVRLSRAFLVASKLETLYELIEIHCFSDSLSLKQGIKHMSTMAHSSNLCFFQHHRLNRLPKNIAAMEEKLKK